MQIIYFGGIIVKNNIYKHFKKNIKDLKPLAEQLVYNPEINETFGEFIICKSELIENGEIDFNANTFGKVLAEYVAFLANITSTALELIDNDEMLGRKFERILDRRERERLKDMQFGD